MKQEKIEQLAKKISIDRATIDQERILTDAEVAFENSQRPKLSRFRVLFWNRFPLVVWAGGLAAAFLIISSWATCFVLSREVDDLRHKLELAQRDTAIARIDDSTTINFFLREHQDVIARNASLNPTIPQPLQIHVNPHNILYYEMFDDQPEYMHPGIIVRGSSSQREIGSPETPVISNGHTMTLSEALENTNFDLVAPPWFHPYYKLEKIRTIEDRDALQLLYTDGISSISLFEQPLDGQRRLSRQDFREYAVYSNAEQAGGMILAWRDDARSYVLIGNTELSQLMNMAQSINAGK